MKSLYLRPPFLIGLAIRIALVIAVLPAPVHEWFVPFLDTSTSQFTLDPWSTWRDQGGTAVAFPYGYVMWLLFLPLTLVAKLLSLPLAIGYGATLLVADIGLLAVLRWMHPGNDRTLIYAYWFSPIVIVASYLLGFNDLVPVLLLAIAMALIKQSNVKWAGVVFVAAVSAKLSMILALPFFVIYMLHNRTIRHLLWKFAAGVGAAAVVMILPFVASRDGLRMLTTNPEIDKIYSLSLAMTGDIKLYLVPLTYTLMLYAAWRIKRLNFDLFYAMLGTAFLLVVLLTPASPGWFIWAIPLLVTYQLRGEAFAFVLSGLFSVLYMVSTLLLGASDTNVINGLNYPWLHNIVGHPDARVVSLVQTTMLAAGIILSVRIWRSSISRNDFFRLSRKPFVIGVAGDSGAGKDTYAAAINGLFGQRSVTSIYGDDYHLWDRQKPMWQVMTHLNPNSNDLERFANDVVALTDGKSIQSRHYDHSTGRMSKPHRISSNDFVIASGLHALYLPILRECYGLSVFLDIDEDLRRHFKMQRDVVERGHSAEKVLESFEKRERDASRFIRQQVMYADLVLSIKPIHPRVLTESRNRGPLRFKLVARSRHGLNEMMLTRVLIGVCGLHVDVNTSENAAEVEITIEGETSAPDVAMAAQMVCPRVLEFLDVEPHWEDGVTGLMQLITLSHINQALTKRFI